MIRESVMSVVSQPQVWKYALLWVVHLCRVLFVFYLLVCLFVFLAKDTYCFGKMCAHWLAQYCLYTQVMKLVCIICSKYLSHVKNLNVILEKHCPCKPHFSFISKSFFAQLQAFSTFYHFFPQRHQPHFLSSLHISRTAATFSPHPLILSSNI